MEQYKGQNWYQENKEKHRETMRNWEKAHPHRNWAYKSRNSHKRAGYTVEVSNEELEDMAKATSHCPICGVELDYTVHTKEGKIHGNSPSLDRKYNGGSITLDTVWIICNRCNRTKGDRSLEEFVEYCKNVANSWG